MFKRPPFFWYFSSPSLGFKIALFIFYPFLWALSFLYKMGADLRGFFYTPRAIKIPVICVGNLSLGGAGKTPTCLALYDTLVSMTHVRKKIHFLTRGYKGSMKGPCRVDLLTHLSSDVGDEAIILAQKGPTWVSRNRYEGGLKAEQEGADLLIMDDGFQNKDLIKKCSFVIVDGSLGFGNQQIFPLGPLREELESGLKRADGVIVVGEDLYGVQECVKRYHPALPLFKARICVDEKASVALKGKKLVAFSGIAAPQKFKKTLEAIEGISCAFFPFPDHYAYSSSDLDFLQEQAQKKGAQLVTTEKDFVRLPSFFQKQVYVVKIALVFEDAEKIKGFLKDQINEDSFL